MEGRLARILEISRNRIHGLLRIKTKEPYRSPMEKAYELAWSRFGGEDGRIVTKDNIFILTNMALSVARNQPPTEETQQEISMLKKAQDLDTSIGRNASFCWFQKQLKKYGLLALDLDDAGDEYFRRTIACATAIQIIRTCAFPDAPKSY